MNPKELIDKYIRALVSREGSDIHLVVGSQVVFRINRSLQIFLQSERLTTEDMQDIVHLLLNKNQLNQLEQKLFLYIRYEHAISPGNICSFRVTLFKESGNPSIVFRLLESPDKTFEELHLPKILESVCAKMNGLFLVVGPSGHGKSTTLAAMVEHINRSYRRFILTIEHPVEFLFKQKESIILQRNVPDDARTFREAVDVSLRSDVDTIMIGEMNSTESIASTITLAEVGHLAFSTLHANSAAQVIHRIIDSFPGHQQNQIRNQLAHTLLGVLSIRLVPRIGGGLIPACEVMFNNSAVGNMIREDRIGSIDNTITTSSDQNMVSLDRYLANLVHEGEITLEHAKMFTNNERTLTQLL